MIREDARWLVRPIDPLYQDAPQVSILPESFLEKRLAYSQLLRIEQAMLSAGFKRGPQCWEKPWRGYVARFTDANIGQAVSPDMTWEPVRGSRFQIDSPDGWALELNTRWDWPNEGLESCREIFRGVVDACARDRGGFRPAAWNGHYKGPSKSGIYTSATAVDGLVISVDDRGNWSVEGKTFPCRNIERPAGPVCLRDRATLSTSAEEDGAGVASIKLRPGETRKVAERWGTTLKIVLKELLHADRG